MRASGESTSISSPSRAPHRGHTSLGACMVRAEAATPQHSSGAHLRRARRAHRKAGCVTCPLSWSRPTDRHGSRTAFQQTCSVAREYDSSLQLFVVGSAAVGQRTRTYALLSRRSTANTASATVRAHRGYIRGETRLAVSAAVSAASPDAKHSGAAGFTHCRSPVGATVARGRTQ